MAGISARRELATGAMEPAVDAERASLVSVVVAESTTPEVVGPIIAEHRIVVYEMSSTGGNLEDAFLQLTGGSAPDGAPGPGGAPGPVETKSG
jgi:hypothetical protein